MMKYPRARVISAVTALLAFALTATPLLAEAPANNLGPVGPREPILVSFGGQRVVAFFAPERGECAVSAVTWQDGGTSAPTASARIRVTLEPGQTLSLDGAERQSMALLCGASASTLAVVAPVELILTGSTTRN